MNISIQTIPHKQHRYSTCGDWYEKDGVLCIRVSQELPEKEALLVALHELIEITLCKDRGITEKQVDEFDMQFEKDREDGKHSEDEEPGDHPDAPYRKEHFFATNIERLMASELGVDWAAYEYRIQTL